MMSQVFGKEYVKENNTHSSPSLPSESATNNNVESIILKSLESRGCTISPSEMSKAKLLYDSLKEAVPVALVGKT